MAAHPPGIWPSAAKNSVMPPAISRMHWNRSAHMTEVNPPWIVYAPTPDGDQQQHELHFPQVTSVKKT